jgi:hypothetical protein
MAPEAALEQVPGFGGDERVSRQPIVELTQAGRGNRVVAISAVG